jgi:hypothetical protein
MTGFIFSRIRRLRLAFTMSRIVRPTPTVGWGADTW